MENNTEQHNQPVQKTTNPQSKWKRFFAKKWVFPGIYMLAAALILAVMWWYQDSQARDDFSLDNQEVGMEQGQELGDDMTGDSLATDEDTMPVGAEMTSLMPPVAEDVEATVAVGFYDETASQEDKEAALIEYNDQFSPHTGIDYALENGEPFDAMAALSGTVESVEAHPLNGQTVRIAHEDDLVTVYQSLGEVSVQEGDTVEQGDTIGQAGRNTLEKDSGVHLHFEVQQDGESVNPEEFMDMAAAQ